MANSGVTNDNSRWLPVFQPLRGLAFFGVFLCHAALVNLGAGSVEIFFLLSGFLAVYSQRRKTPDRSLRGTLGYTVKKVRKLYLLHLLMLLVLLLPVVRSVRNGYISTTPRELATQAALNVLLLESWFPYKEIYFAFNGTAWFLSSSVIMYLLTPLMMPWFQGLSAKGARRGILAIVLALLVAALFATMAEGRRVSLNTTYWLLYIFPVTRLGDYVIGCLLAVLVLHRQEEGVKLSRGAATAWELLAVLLFGAVQYCYVSSNWPLAPYNLRYTLPHLPGAAMLIYFGALRQGDLLRRLECRPLLFLGEIGMYGFLIHVPVITYFDKIYHHLSPDPANPLLRGLICFVVTVLLSVAWKHVSAWLHRRAPVLV